MTGCHHLWSTPVTFQTQETSKVQQSRLSNEPFLDVVTIIVRLMYIGADFLHRLSSSHLVSLTELKPKVHQVLHPDESVSILVTHIENLLQPLQEHDELLLIR